MWKQLKDMHIKKKTHMKPYYYTHVTFFNGKNISFCQEALSVFTY